MKKTLVIVSPVVLGIASLVCTYLYVTNHQRAWQIIRDTRDSTSRDDFARVVHRRLDEGISGVEGYHVVSLALAVLAVVSALAVLPDRWYAGVPPRMKVFRSVNLVFGIGSLLFALVQV